MSPVTQMGQGEHSLASGVEAPPPRSALVPVLADKACEVIQSPGGQRNRSRVRQHSETPGWGVGFWSTAVLPGASSCVHLGLRSTVTCTVTMKMAH